MAAWLLRSQAIHRQILLPAYPLGPVSTLSRYDGYEITYTIVIMEHVRAACHQHDVTARIARTSVIHVSCPVLRLYSTVAIASHDGTPASCTMDRILHCKSRFRSKHKAANIDHRMMPFAAVIHQDCTALTEAKSRGQFFALVHAEHMFDPHPHIRRSAAFKLENDTFTRGVLISRTSVISMPTRGPGALHTHWVRCLCDIDCTLRMALLTYGASQLIF